MGGAGASGYHRRVWTLDARDGVDRLLAGAVYLGAVVAFLLAQELGLRLRRAEHRAWWAGSGRDLLNVAGVFAIAGALRLVGLSPGAALLVGGTLTLLMFGASVLVATQLDTRHPRTWSFAAGLALAVPVLLFPGEVVGAVASIADALFPAHR
jgi:uncharacterized membrane protein YgdD (TMEM256/DUF423 family)